MIGNDGKVVALADEPTPSAPHRRSDQWVAMARHRVCFWFIVSDVLVVFALNMKPKPLRDPLEP
jgi:hypothetical protein